MLAWTQQNTMQRAMRTVLEWPQSHAISKTINMLTNKSEPQQKCRLGTVSKILLGGLKFQFGYFIMVSCCLFCFFGKRAFVFQEIFFFNQIFNKYIACICTTLTNTQKLTVLKKHNFILSSKKIAISKN